VPVELPHHLQGVSVRAKGNFHAAFDTPGNESDRRAGGVVEVDLGGGVRLCEHRRQRLVEVVSRLLEPRQHPEGVGEDVDPLAQQCRAGVEEPGVALLSRCVFDGLRAEVQCADQQIDPAPVVVVEGQVAIGVEFDLQPDADVPALALPDGLGEPAVRRHSAVFGRSPDRRLVDVSAFPEIVGRDVELRSVFGQADAGQPDLLGARDHAVGGQAVLPAVGQFGMAMGVIDRHGWLAVVRSGKQHYNHSPCQIDGFFPRREAPMGAMEYRTVLETVVGGQDLSEDQAEAVFSELMDGQLTEAQTAGLLMALATKGPAISEIAGAARAMRAHAVRIDPGGADVVDIVGTGGTGISTFNISTTSCFVAAGAGAKVAKHGNITNTRASGAANVLDALGVKLDVPPETVTRCITEAGVGFCYARACHPAMKHAAPVRKQLPVRTIFNVLGPLTNPAGARRQVMGVYCPEAVQPLAETLGRLGVSRAWVMHAEDGLDELTITAPTGVTELRDGHLHSFTVQPEDVGLQRGSLGDLIIDSPEASADRCRAILRGEQAGPARDIVLLNAAAALVVCDRASDLADGVDRARQSIESGAAENALCRLVEITNG
jgi:anthranilate phosphoribosyltransferase